MDVRNLVKALLGSSKVVFPIFVFIIVVMAFYAVQIPIDPSFNSLISDDTEYNINERLVANVLGNGDFIEVLFKPDDASILMDRPTSMNESDVVGYMDDVKSTLMESTYVDDIIGPEFSDDKYYARLLLSVDTPRDTQGFRTVIDDINYYFDQISEYPGVESTVTGTPLIFNRVNTLLINDNIRTIAFALISVFLVLLFYFKNLRMTLITLSVPLSSLIMLAGLMTIFHIPITITLAIVGILVVGLGVDFAIHVAVSYESYRQKGFNHKESIIESIDHLNIAILGSLFTTIAGFASLMFGVTPSSQGQGLVLTMAISLVGMITILVFPCILFLFGEIRVFPEKSRIFITSKNFLNRLASFQISHPKEVLSILSVLTIFMAIFATNVGFDTSNENWIPDDDPIQETFRESSYAFGNSFSSITLVLESDNLNDVQVVRDMQELERSFLASRNIEGVNSPFSDIDLRRSEVIDNLHGSFNEEYTLGTISVDTRSFEVEEGGSSVILDEIRRIIEENPVYGTDISLFGDVVRFNELGASLGRDTGITTLISFLAVFLIASLLYFSFKTGFIALIPVIIAIVWTVGFMGLTGVPFTSLSTGLIALVLGTGVDFSIHLTNSTFNLVDDGNKLNDAIKETMNSSGSALLLTSITTFIGFSSLLVATLLGIQRLGLTLAFSILSVFIVTIVAVPAVLSLMLKKSKKKSKI